MDGKLLGGRKEVVGDYVFQRSVKSILPLGLLDVFSGFIALIPLIFCHLANIRDVFKDC